jgi:hypothetical protein
MDPILAVGPGLIAGLYHGLRCAGGVRRDQRSPHPFGPNGAAA